MKYSSAKTDNSGEKPLLQRPVFTIILISVMKSFSKTYNTCHAFLPPPPPPPNTHTPDRESKGFLTIWAKVVTSVQACI